MARVSGKASGKGRTLPCGRMTAEGSRSKTEKFAETLKICQERLDRYVANQGLKHSDQRWKIAELVLETGGHLDAQALVERVKQRHPEIGAATVYRNLKVLCDANILKESLTDAQGRVVYEIFDEDHHDHIVCSDCGEIFEFHNEKIESLQNTVIREMDFTQVKHRHVIYAKCDLKKAKYPLT